MNLILLYDKDFIDDRTVVLRDHRADHIRTILRAAAGDSLSIGRLDGPVGVGRIERLDRSEVRLSIEQWTEAELPLPGIHVICALPRPQLLRRVLRTVGMMGVRRLDLIRANRVEKSFFDSPLLEPDAYTAYLHEGMSQGKFTRTPEVAIHRRFKPFWEDTFPTLLTSDRTIRILAHGETDRRLNSLSINRQSKLVLAVGPEGGWVPFEVDMMSTLGFEMVTLGPWVLRVDAALVAALSQIELCAELPA